MHGNTRQSYDRLSRWYDWFSSSEEVFTRQAVELLALRPEEDVLEIGCGTGKALGYIASRAGIVGCTLGVDLSMGMARRAAERASRGSLVSRTGFARISVCQGDALFLPLASASFDALLFAFTLELFSPEEIPAVLDECQRLLRPGGRLAAVSLAETDLPGLMERGYGWVQRKLPRLVDCRPIRLGPILAVQGFHILHRKQGSLWGLPVEIVIAGSANGCAAAYRPHPHQDPGPVD